MGYKVLGSWDILVDSRAVLMPITLHRFGVEITYQHIVVKVRGALDPCETLTRKGFCCVIESRNLLRGE